MTKYRKVYRDHEDPETGLRWCHTPGQSFAFKNPGGRKWRIDREKFNKWHGARRSRG